MFRSTLRNGLLLALTTAAAGTLEAQYTWDIGFHLGGANYLGEMGGKEKPGRRNDRGNCSIVEKRGAVRKQAPFRGLGG